jgi:hypothetical protein
VVALAAIYSGYWFVGARAVNRSIPDVVAQMRDGGWDVRHGDVTVRGYPSRFDSTITAPFLSPPDAAWSWETPFFQVFALAYQPNKVIATMADTQRLRLGDQVLDIQTERLRASGAVAARTDLALDAITVEVAAATVTSDRGWQISLARALGAMRAATGEAAYDIHFDLDDIALPPEILRAAGPAGDVASTMQNFVLDGTVALDQTLDRRVVMPVLVRAVELRQMVVDWGDVTVRADGALTFDALGVPDGKVTLRTAQWETLIDLMSASGLIDPGVTPTVKNVARAMSGGGGVLDLPVVIRNGQMAVGPVPLGPAPRLGQLPG